jgi:hypothetical protein
MVAFLWLWCLILVAVGLRRVTDRRIVVQSMAIVAFVVSGRALLLVLVRLAATVITTSVVVVLVAARVRHARTIRCVV